MEHWIKMLSPGDFNRNSMTDIDESLLTLGAIIRGSVVISALPVDL
jgi:hypothetical protein